MGCKGGRSVFHNRLENALGRFPQRPQAPPEISKKESFIWNKEGGFNLVEAMENAHAASKTAEFVEQLFDGQRR